MIDGQVLFLNLKLPLEHVRVATVFGKQGSAHGSYRLSMFALQHWHGVRWDTYPHWLPLEHVRVATTTLPNFVKEANRLPLEHVRVATKTTSSTHLDWMLVTA